MSNRKRKYTAIILNAPTISNKSKKSEVIRPRIRKKFMQIQKTVPIQQKCDGSTRPVYVTATSRSIVKSPSGVVTILNTSEDSTMKVTFGRAKGDSGTIRVGPKSSFTATVSNIKSIYVACTGGADESCTGKIDLNLFFVVEF